MTMPRTCGLAVAAVALFMSSAPAIASDIRQIPDEYETTSGHGVAMNNAGYGATDGFSAIRANPALLGASKQYTVSAGYHWPSAGRDYYQAAVVDGKTQSVAVGVSYTSYADDYQYTHNANLERTGASASDSPIVRRMVLGVGQNFGAISAGVGATYVEANALDGSPELERGDLRVKGLGLNAGAAITISPNMTAGASVENLSNPKIKDYVPRTFRAGAAYQFSPMVVGYLDARQRDRVPLLEAQPVDINDETATSAKEMRDPERMVIASLTAQVQDFLRLIGSYGSALGDDRRSVAGGVAVVNKNFSLSYTAARPYMKQTAAHQAVTLSLEMAM